MIGLLVGAALAQDPSEIVAPWPKGFECGAPTGDRNAVVYERCLNRDSGVVLSARVYAGMEAAPLDEVCAAATAQLVGMMSGVVEQIDGRSTHQAHEACNTEVGGVLAGQEIGAAFRQVLVPAEGRWYLILGMHTLALDATDLAAWDAWFADTRFVALDPPAPPPKSRKKRAP